MSEIKISLIWAMSENRTIGLNNKLPWHLPEDLKYFKQTTIGKPIIMGRKTYESIGIPLPGRQNIVISHDKSYKAKGVNVEHSLENAIEFAYITKFRDAKEYVVIGGAEIYTLALPYAQRLYLTQVHSEVAGDTFFPEFDLGNWQEIKRVDFYADECNPHDYSFIVLENDND